MKKLCKLFLLTTLLVISLNLLADAPDGYYDSAEGLSGDALKSALNDIIDNHNELSYSQVWNALKDTDEDPNNPNHVILLYTGWSVTDAGYPTWNREHTWAKSHGNFGTNPPCGTDIHHLRPTDPDVNSARGNKDFDNGGTQHPIATGCYYDSDSWEPRDEVKGDVARMIFYMATRYEGEHGELDLQVVDEVNTDPAPEHGKLSTLLEWNLQDPPDDFEMTRNDRIYENWQGNRNPFVDHPEFAQYIWGGQTPGLYANFSATPLSGSAPLNVQFTDTSSGDIISWEWDFDNDGIIDSNENNPSYTFTEVGNYSVKLTVSNGSQNSEIVKNSYITVSEPGTEPIILLSESFESGFGSWEHISYASESDWEINNDTSGYTFPSSVPDGNFYAYINNYNSDEPADDWIISPEIDLTGYENCNLTFNAWTNFTDDITGLKLYASANGEDWQEISANLGSYQAQNWTQSSEIDLSSFSNTVYIAFQYETTGTSGGSCKAWALDAINISGTIEADIEENQINPDFTLRSYPNPIHLSDSQNSKSIISFNLPENCNNAKLKIYNLKGQLVNSFTINPNQKNQNIIWDLKDRNNRQVSSGLYFMKLNVDNKELNFRKTLILK